MKNKISFLLVFFVFFLKPEISIGCTNYLITKSASTDGSTMISYAADSHVLYGELYHWPAAKWPAGTMMDVYEWDTGKHLGKIKQAAKTYNVVGNMNEFQVAIGETTYGGREELGKQDGAIMDYGSLIYIALQRSKTAREAIKVMTDLVAEYGYYSSGESFSIADANEVWIMEMIGKGQGQKGAVWVALLIPDGYVSSHANQARITTFDYQKENLWSDTKATVFNSSDVISFARDKGWFKGKDKEFSFSDTYAPVDFGGARFCEIRVYSMFHKISQEFASNKSYWEYSKGNIEHDGKNNYASNRMPLWVKPDRKISVRDMMDFMRDHLEGTELDMSKDFGAMPYGNPYRWRNLTWKVDGETYCHERATATQQTGFVFVAQSRAWLPRQVGGILWFGVDDAASTVFMPMYSSITQTPEKMAVGYGSIMEFVPDAAFWVFNQVSNLAYTRYDSIHADIDVKQKALESKFVEQVIAMDAVAASMMEKNPAGAVKFLTEFSVNTGNATVLEWQKFYYFLFAKYMDGNIKRVKPVPADHKYIPPHVNFPGYPEQWYRKIVEDTGDKLKVKGSAH
ncbi:MAG: C69 family dipeptidase [Bacteroidales bacterium]|nr:C69 family dipeptidase [Bacteroidales bacterium]